MSYKKTLYKYHRKIGILIMIPVFLWVISGLMHPFMSNWFRPEIAKTYLRPMAIDQSQIQYTLRQVADKNKIEIFKNANFISLNNQLVYQFHFNHDSLVYVNASTGEIIKNAELGYAEELARTFLEDNTAEITSFEKVTEFTTEYREINRLLPVWKVSFDRPDGMTLYIHTASSRLGTFNNTYRKWHVRIFNWFHNWGFIPGPYWLRVLLVGFFSAFIFVVSLLGLVIYGVNWKKFKKIKVVEKRQLKRRRLHRRTGIIFSVFMLLFSFSGSYHVWIKVDPDDRRCFYDESDIPKMNLVSETLPSSLVNFSVHNMDGLIYYRYVIATEKGKKVQFINAQTGIELENGEQEYAKHLAQRFSTLKTVTEISGVFSFKGEYGFVNKRLPVQKVVFHTPNNDTYYIETKTGKLAAKVDDVARTEGYSFAVFHKFHFIDGMGKSTRDFIVMLGALSLVIIAWFGWRIRRK